MRLRVVAVAAVLIAGASGARAGDEVSSEWAKVAGEHMGRAEAAATCKGYKLNAIRRDEIFGLFPEPELRRRIERFRDEMRDSRIKAMQETPTVCETLLSMYGPRGIWIRNYVVGAASVPVPDTPGVDRGRGMIDDPAAVDAMHWIVLLGPATAIETKCKGYAMVPVLEGQLFVMGQRVSSKGELMAMVMASTSNAAKEFGFDGDRRAACARAIAEYGPGSPTPVVKRK